VQLRRLPAENERRSRISATYRQALSGAHGLAMPFPDAAAQRTASHHLAVVLLPDGVARADVRAALEAERIQTSVHYPPIHTFTAYAQIGARRPLPTTELVGARVLTLPLYGGMSDAQVETVVEALGRAVASAA
jgi:dTDP-4-amino-4,6-dideoxygalactose transaminase